MESLLNGMDSILNDSLNQLLSSYPVISTSTSTDSLFLSWNSPLRILSNQLEQLTTLIDQSTAKSSSQEALSFSLKKLIRQVDLSSNGQSEDEDEDQREEADAHPQNQREIQAWRDLFCRLDVVFATRAADILDNTQSLIYLEEALETLTVSQCYKVWDYIEARVSELTHGLVPGRGKSLAILRTSNELLRRLRKPSKSHASLAGRILSFLAKVFPLGEKSGQNMGGSFHVENETKLEPLGKLMAFNEKNEIEKKRKVVVETNHSDASSLSPAPESEEDEEEEKVEVREEEMMEKEVDERKEVSFYLEKKEDGETEPSDPFDLNPENLKDPGQSLAQENLFYEKFWNLQKFFSDPGKLWEDCDEKVRVRKEEIVVDEVEVEVEEEIEEEERERLREERKEDMKDDGNEEEKKEVEEKKDEMDVDEKKSERTSKGKEGSSNHTSGSSTPTNHQTSTSKNKEKSIPTHRKINKVVRRERTLIKYFTETQVRSGWISFQENTVLILKLFECVGKREVELEGDDGRHREANLKNNSLSNPEKTVVDSEQQEAGKDLDPMKSLGNKRKRDEISKDQMEIDDLDFDSTQKIGASSSQEDFFPKYLTGRRVLSYELRDPSFRRHILIQYLILFTYLLRLEPKIRMEWDSKMTNITLRRTLNNQLKLPLGSAGNSSNPKDMTLLDDSDERLGSRDQIWVRMKWRDAIGVLNGIHPDGPGTVAAVRVALRRDSNWADWKDSNCPSIEKSPLTILSEQMAAKSLAALLRPVSAFPHPLGTVSLSELWEGGLRPVKTTITMESRESEEEIDQATGEPKRIMVEVKRDGLEDLEIMPPIPDLRSYARLVKQADARIDGRRKTLGTWKDKQELKKEESLIQEKVEIDEKEKEKIKKEKVEDENPSSSDSGKDSNSKDQNSEDSKPSKKAKQIEEAIESRSLRETTELEDEDLSNLIERKQSLSWRALRVARSQHLNLFSKIQTDDILTLQLEVENEVKRQDEKRREIKIPTIKTTEFSSPISHSTLGNQEIQSQDLVSLGSSPPRMLSGAVSNADPRPQDDVEMSEP